MFWLSRVNEHSHYASGLLGPMLVTAAGLGLIFVPLSLRAGGRAERGFLITWPGRTAGGTE